MTRRCLGMALLLSSLGGPFAAAQDRPTVAPERLAQEVQERAAQREVLDRRLRGERPDPTWAPLVERSLRESLGRAQEADLRGREIRCAQTLCRVVLWHASPAAQDRVLARTAGAPGFDLPGMAHVEWNERGGGAVTYIYLQRPLPAAPAHPKK